jgi:hypothetical protein
MNVQKNKLYLLRRYIESERILFVRMLKIIAFREGMIKSDSLLAILEQIIF